MHLRGCICKVNAAMVNMIVITTICNESVHNAFQQKKSIPLIRMILINREINYLKMNYSFEKIHASIV